MASRLGVSVQTLASGIWDDGDEPGQPSWPSRGAGAEGGVIGGSRSSQSRGCRSLASASASTISSMCQATGPPLSPSRWPGARCCTLVSGVVKAHQRGEALLALAEAEAVIAAYRVAHAAAIDDAAMARAEVLIVAYDARWAASMADYEVIGVEVEFVATIPGRKRLRVAGKLDAILRRRADGVVMFVEHKTSGADLSLGSTYWARLRMDPQVSIYFAGARELGHDPHACIYDVIVRPDLRPLKATPVELRKYTKPTAKEPVSRLYANQRENDETIDEFRARLAAAVVAAPETYFARAEIVRLESEIEESQRDVEELALQIRQGPITGVAARNPNACFLYGRTCSFLGACGKAGRRRSTTRRSFARPSASTKSFQSSTNHQPPNAEEEGTMATTTCSENETRATTTNQPTRSREERCHHRTEAIHHLRGRGHREDDARGRRAEPDLL